MITRLPTLVRVSSSLLRAVLFWIVFVVFVLGGAAAGTLGILRLVASNPVVATLALDLPLPGNNSKATTDADAEPDWRNLGRVTVLIMGVDRREDEGNDWPARTDTMMLATIDPGGLTAGILGIPRDLLVPIAMPSKDCQYLPWGNPYAQDRINTAYVYGELCSYRGGGGTGGPGLAKDTVQYNFGVRVHYYALVDFNGFSALIDALGGIDLDVPETLIDNQYPTPDYGVMRIHIPKGPQHLDGEKALWYVRSRHMDSDFGRIHRQQQVLLAVRDRLMRLDMVPKYPQLLKRLSETIETDMTAGQLLALALAAREVPAAAITGASLEYPLVTSLTGHDGAALLLPNRERIRGLITELFADSRLKNEAPRVEILNSTTAPGLAKATADRLRDRGFTEVTIGNTDDGQTRARTEIFDLTGKSYSASLVASTLGLTADRIKAGTSVSAGGAADIRVVLGEDLRPR